MIEISDLSESEITGLLERVGFAHLGCCREGRPYVVPIHYGFSNGKIYIYTTEGKKSEVITENSYVCLQIEDVVDNRHWESVVIDGKAVTIDDDKERKEALGAVLAVNPTLTPAVSIHWMDEWVRENIEVIYRIDILATSGRRSLARSSSPIMVPATGIPGDSAH
jgi:nitroimidazol reductase NimA-like FMN-containing flavoprotein (pyridoxamine 5'-phosphate oxidase superfamily)